MIALELDLEQSVFLPNEDVLLEVKVSNGGSSPVTVQDPAAPTNVQIVYLVKGPGFPEGRTYDAWSLESEEPASRRRPEEVSLGPGESRTGAVSMQKLASRSGPGEYRVLARLQLGDRTVLSEARAFRVDPFAPRAIHIGIAMRGQGTAEGEGAFIQAEQLYTFRFLEDSPEIAEASVGEPVRRAGVAPDAGDVLIPFRNGPFFDEC